MKGRVAFWFRIRRQGDQIVCEALFKLFGQQCNFCNQRDSSSEVIVWWILFIGNFSLILFYCLYFCSSWLRFGIRTRSRMLLVSLQAKSSCHTTEAEETRSIASFPMKVFVAANRDKAHHWFIAILLDAKLAKTDGVSLPVSLPNCFIYVYFYINLLSSNLYCTILENNGS